MKTDIKELVELVRDARFNLAGKVRTPNEEAWLRQAVKVLAKYGRDNYGFPNPQAACLTYRSKSYV